MMSAPIPKCGKVAATLRMAAQARQLGPGTLSGYGYLLDWLSRELPEVALAAAGHHSRHRPPERPQLGGQQPFIGHGPDGI